MKILWHSATPLSIGGYANQTRLTVPRLIQAGHDVAVSAWNATRGSMQKFQGVPVYGGGRHRYGMDAIMPHARAHFGNPKNGLVLTLLDPWALTDHHTLSQLNLASLVPVDQQPLPPRTHQWIESTQALPIAYSRFGEKILQEAGFQPFYVPHAIDMDMFKPAEDRMQVREELGLPTDDFVVSMVAANLGNPSRKSFPEALTAFAQLQREKPDTALYLHTGLQGFDAVDAGVNLEILVEQLGIENVIAVDQERYEYHGYPDWYLAKVYQASDVLLNPARGEGFGLPVLEAQACGTPVITNGFSAMLELTFAGWVVRGRREYTSQHSWWQVPDVGEIVEALRDAYDSAEGMREMAVESVRHYNIDKVVKKHWVPTLEEIERRLTVMQGAV